MPVVKLGGLGDGRGRKLKITECIALPVTKFVQTVPGIVDYIPGVVDVRAHPPRGET